MRCCRHGPLMLGSYLIRFLCPTSTNVTAVSAVKRTARPLFEGDRHHSSTSVGRVYNYIAYAVAPQVSHDSQCKNCKTFNAPLQLLTIIGKGYITTPSSEPCQGSRGTRQANRRPLTSVSHETILVMNGLFLSSSGAKSASLPDCSTFDPLGDLDHHYTVQYLVSGPMCGFRFSAPRHDRITTAIVTVSMSFIIL